ncbi:Uma2 family endonuclease [Allonocardiopsis opalescens]|uniref:Uma2 family endonuclease n=1 Tax=Allonocardiopsis opalescens TaxID=1144618 RepID=A0A2T0PUH0_9ACTN|nr:Uma2 family endonuclease [Allonocardiopsis opalescens]PRX92541.1 Uma2 family endonuclease [Allonocardiopsis opalescens]
MDPDDFPDWLIPPTRGFTADDLDRMPGLRPHTELIDGSLIIPGYQTAFHSATISALGFALHDAVPEGLLARTRMTIRLGPRQRPEPDLVVISAEAETGLDQTWYAGEHVRLAVEVVMPESELRDRLRKPQLYAEAGIPHLWRVEGVRGKPAVHVYELDPATRGYALTGVHRERLRLTVPFGIDIDLAGIRHR